MVVTSAPACTTSSVTVHRRVGCLRLVLLHPGLACSTVVLLWLGPSGAGSLESVLWLQLWLQGWWRVESQEFDPYLPSSLSLKLAQGATSSCWHLGGPNWTELNYLREFNQDSIFQHNDICIYHITPVWMCFSRFFLQICKVVAIFANPFFCNSAALFKPCHTALFKQGTLFNQGSTV